MQVCVLWFAAQTEHLSPKPPCQTFAAQVSISRSIGMVHKTNEHPRMYTFLRRVFRESNLCAQHFGLAGKPSSKASQTALPVRLHLSAWPPTLSHSMHHCGQSMETSPSKLAASMTHGFLRLTRSCCKRLLCQQHPNATLALEAVHRGRPQAPEQKAHHCVLVELRNHQAAVEPRPQLRNVQCQAALEAVTAVSLLQQSKQLPCITPPMPVARSAAAIKTLNLWAHSAVDLP